MDFYAMAKDLVCILESSEEDKLFELLYGEGYTSEEIEAFIAEANQID